VSRARIVAGLLAATLAGCGGCGERRPPPEPPPSDASRFTPFHARTFEELCALVKVVTDPARCEPVERLVSECGLERPLLVSLTRHLGVGRPEPLLTDGRCTGEGFRLVPASGLDGSRRGLAIRLVWEEGVERFAVTPRCFGCEREPAGEQKMKECGAVVGVITDIPGEGRSEIECL
jgi:hypothetical protein